MIPVEQRFAILDLLSDCAAAQDRGDFTAWLEFFAETCTYRVIPRENHDLGLPVCLIRCDNRDMLRDRIMSLLEANEYNLHADHHTVTNSRFTKVDGDRVDVESSYTVYQIDLEGEAMLFSVGHYRDTVLLGAGTPKLLSRLVIVDNFTIPRAISTPI